MAKAIVLRKKEAIKEAMVREEGLIFWTDGSRLENGKVGSAVVWKEGEQWKEERSYLGKKKEVFDAEVYAIMRAMRKATEIDNNERVDKITIFSNSTTAIRRVQDTEPGPGQAMAITCVNLNTRLAGMGVQVEYRWVPSHEGVEGNEEADEAAKKAAVNEEEGILRLQDRYKGWSMAKVHVEHVNLHSSRAGGAMVAHPSSTEKVLGSTPGQSILFLVSTVQRRVTKAK